MIEYLIWDSEFFNKKIYSVSMDARLPASQLNQIFKELQDLGADGAYIILKHLNKPLQDGLKSYNIPLMDVKITYEKRLSPAIRSLKPNVAIKHNRGTVTSQLVNLSLEAGKHSRFKVDKVLSPKFKELYTLWIERSVKRVIADGVLVCSEDGLEKGMVTYKIKDDIGIIGLIGVDSSVQGQGIGTKLVSAVEDNYLNNNILISQVATQACNEIACRFYSKLGYSVKSIQPIYHLWF